MTNEQIEQKKQLLAEKMEEVKALYKELVEAGAIEMSDEELDKAAGGSIMGDWLNRKVEPYPQTPSVLR